MLNLLITSYFEKVIFSCQEAFQTQQTCYGKYPVWIEFESEEILVLLT